MSDLRKDPIVGRWVIIATDRAKRPQDFARLEPVKSGGFCPFCKGNESNTPPEILAYREPHTGSNNPGWRVRVVPNKFPALTVEGALNKRGDGIYDLMNGVGAHEVIIECPHHESSMARLSVDTAISSASVPCRVAPSISAARESFIMLMRRRASRAWDSS